MRVSQLVAPGESVVVTAPVPEPEHGEVLVHIIACGVCASELHSWADGVGTYPHRFGHEPVGVISAVGADVTSFRKGDRVTGLVKGAFAEYCLADPAVLLPIPDTVSDEAALGEPLACLVNAQRRTSIKLADRVVIVGLGYMGLGLLQLARLRGPRRIVGIDVRQDARDRARYLGADETYHPDDLPPDFVLTEFRAWQSDRGFDVVVEASGTQPGLELAGRLVRAHGLLSILGYHQGGPRSVDVEMWNWKAIDVVNAHVRRRADLLESMRIGLELEANKMIDLGRLVTHRYSLDDIDQAYADLRAKPPGFIKAVVFP